MRAGPLGFPALAALRPVTPFPRERQIMTRPLIANCLDKISAQLGDIRLCSESMDDPQACLLAENMEHVFLTDSERLRCHLDLKSNPRRCVLGWHGRQDPLRFLSDAFARVHDYLSSLRSHATSLGDPRTWELVTNLELGVLRFMRRLRLLLDIPYDWHERVENLQEDSVCTAREGGVQE